MLWNLARLANQILAHFSRSSRSRPTLFVLALEFLLLAKSLAA